MGRTRNGLCSLKPRAILTSEDLIVFCRRSLATYKLPRRVEFQKRICQEQFRQGTEEDSARAFLDASATRRELTPNSLRIVGRFVQPEVLDHLCERETKTQNEGNRNEQSAGRPSTNTLSSVVDYW